MLVFDYLENSYAKYPDKIAYADENKSMDYKTLREHTYHIASVIADKGYFKKPVAIFLDKSVECIAAFLGTAYSGNFYSPLDTKMPEARIEKIMTTLQPQIVITDRAHAEVVKNFAGNADILIYEDMCEEEIDERLVKGTISKVLDTDVLYVLFTSGSTGNPKGVIISHRALVDFVEWGTKYLGIDDSYVFGNQTPFYFSMSVFDIYMTLKNGATMHVIPKEKFSFPAKLMEELYDKKINTLFWVPSALTMVSALNALNCPHLPELKNVFFGGEVMPMKQLNKWRKEYPDVRYINFYGPTEVTDTCTIYEVNREFENTETLPMGFACENMDVFLLDENDKLVADGEIGEVCVRGTGLAYGYYNAPDKTAEAFVQNPLNKVYPETIYRTGDLAQINQYGEFVYAGRKDFQIKHMGHRIELGEIETAVLSVNEVESGCCLYDDKRSRIVLFYTGDIEEKALMDKIKDLVPSYMMPNKHYHLEEMPKNLNGKIDRQKLKGMI